MEFLQNIYNVEKWTKEIYFKIFLPILLPNVDKILHLDADLWVLGDVKILFDIDMGDNLYLAATSNTSPNINVGALMCNIELARQLDCINVLSSFISYQIKNNAKNYEIAEEYTINECFKNKIMLYDNILHILSENYQIQNPLIAHFIAIKPWHMDRPIKKAYFKNLYLIYCDNFKEFTHHPLIIKLIFYYCLYGGYYINSIVKRIKNFIFKYIFTQPKYAYIHNSFIMNILKTIAIYK